MNNIKMVFFGSSKFSVYCLEELKTLGIIPNLIVTTPDAPTGRGLILTGTPVKAWAEENNIKCLTPKSLRTEEIFNTLKEHNPDLFLVASYGKIVPENIIDLPKYKTLNIHPSLLPKYRGPSPLQEQILHDEKNVGVTIMLMDKEVDHGPIIKQEAVTIPDWPVKLDELKVILAKTSADLFASVINDWIEGKIVPTEQNHEQATFTKKVEKTDGLIDIVNGDTYKNFLKIQAYSTWPQTYFFLEKGNKKIRVIIKEAKFVDEKLEILRVVPEGKKEMNYEDFLRGLK